MLKNCAELPAKIPGVAVPDSTVHQDRVLVCGGQFEKPFAARRVRIAIQRRQARGVGRLRAGQRATERAVDVVRRSRLFRARTERIGGDQPIDHRLEQIGLRRRHVFESLARRAGTRGRRLHRCGRCGLGRRGVRCGDERRRNRDRSRAGDAYASQDVATGDDSWFIGHW